MPKFAKVCGTMQNWYIIKLYDKKYITKKYLKIPLNHFISEINGKRSCLPHSKYLGSLCMCHHKMFKCCAMETSGQRPYSLNCRTTGSHPLISKCPNKSRNKLKFAPPPLKIAQTY